ncbi:Protein of unknown function [Nitrosomonas sp. Nm58]|nr:Protein of unknown function [Nitrosomonas sp. Nm58]
MLLSACVSPVEGLWPPPPDSTMRTIYVSLDAWHAMIAFPQSKGLATNSGQSEGYPLPRASSFLNYSLLSAPNQHFEEWGYAERAWYLEGRRGVTGVIRALFWPTEGVVEIGWYDQVWAERTHQPPSDLFIFHVSEEGYRRLRGHLQATIMHHNPVAVSDSSLFYSAKHSYHAFHTCHQYAAQALRKAGLPLSPFWAFNRSSFAWQLRHAAQIAEKQPANMLLEQKDGTRQTGLF